MSLPNNISLNSSVLENERLEKHLKNVAKKDTAPFTVYHNININASKTLYFGLLK